MGARPFALKTPTPMPGWGLSVGIMVTMLSVIVLIPMAVLLWRGFVGFGAAEMWEVVNRPRVWSALGLSFRAALVASLFNLVFGVLLAWVLVRYHFPGKRIIDAAVDLPFALPTAVAGIALTAIYAPNGVLGSVIGDAFGIRVAYTELGIWIALIFVGLPFVVRTVQPVIEEIDRETEEASATLGAGRWHTLRHVVLPMLAPAALTGFALALAAAAPGELVLDNGSGLSRHTRMTAQWLVHLLQHAWSSPVMPELMASLPVNGLDGTMRRSRAPAGRAHLKTGSLRDVAGLAGYVLDDQGRRRVLVAVIQHPNANAARPALDALVQWALKAP